MKLKIYFSTLVFIICISCTRSCNHFPDSMAPLEVNLYNGIEKVARLGDNEAQVKQRAVESFDKEAAPDYLKKLGFDNVAVFPNLGVKVYFQLGRAALIEMQPPFKGHIQGKSLTIFNLTPPAGKNWETDLIKEFGTPYMRASGGRFSSEALFYPWGDVSYNRSGPNEIAIYRLPEIGRWRATDFGREVQLFKKEPKNN